MRTALFVLMTLGTLSAYADELILEQPGLSEQQLDSSEEANITSTSRV